MQGVEFYNI